MPFAEVILALYPKNIYGKEGESGARLWRGFVHLEMAALQADAALGLGQAGSQPPLAGARPPGQDATCTARKVTLTQDVSWFASKVK